MSDAATNAQMPDTKQIRLGAWSVFYLLLSGAIIWGVRIMIAWQRL